MASIALAWPYKIDCSYAPSNSVKKFFVSSITIHINLRKDKTMESTLLTSTKQIISRMNSTTLLYARLNNSPRGFGPSPKKTKRTKKSKPSYESDSDGEEEEEETDEEDGIIPEIVTNRMISRMGFSVGIPFLVGLLFFPFFYYVKVVLKIDVPSWVPIIVSFFFLGAALSGVSYGIVSSSWDPMREGSLLGWNEARKNWPVFWQSLWGESGSRKK